MSTEQGKVEIERIELEDNPRKDLGDVDKLAASIKTEGLLQPLVVRHVKEGNKYRYILKAGHRRYEAILRIRKEDPKAFATIPVTLYHGNDDDARFAQLAENIQRKDLNAVELADGIREMTNKGYEVKVVSERVGLSATWVGKLLKVREGCIPAVLKALAKGDLSISASWAFIGLTESEQAKLLEKCLTTKAEETAKGRKGHKAVKRDVDKATKKSLPGKRKLTKLLALVDDKFSGSGVYWRGVAAALAYALGEDEILLAEMEKEAKKCGFSLDGSEPPEAPEPPEAEEDVEETGDEQEDSGDEAETTDA
jgi:ParB family chromosome partitioning protein